MSSHDTDVILYTSINTVAGVLDGPSPNISDNPSNVTSAFTSGCDNIAFNSEPNNKRPLSYL